MAVTIKPKFSCELKPLSIPCKRTGPTRKLRIISNWLTILRLLLISNVNTNVNKPVRLEAYNNLSDILEASNNLSDTVSSVIKNHCSDGNIKWWNNHDMKPHIRVHHENRDNNLRWSYVSGDTNSLLPVSYTHLDAADE